jgi:putative ribosome biogenesis GTPase RsgA
LLEIPGSETTAWNYNALNFYFVELTNSQIGASGAGKTSLLNVIVRVQFWYMYWNERD